MKIIGVSNFDLDSVADSLICENVNEYYGKIIVEALNNKLSHDYSTYFYKLVEDNHKLYIFEP